MVLCSLTMMLVAAAPDAGSGQRFPGLESDAFTGRGQLDFSPGPQGFEISMHEGMALDAGAGSCSHRLADAQWRQDIFQMFEAEAHFDNCAFFESLTYTQKKFQEAERAFARAKTLTNKKEAAAARDEGLSRLGEALHGIQDFYSHSTYLDYLVRANPGKLPEGTSFESLDTLDLWELKKKDEILALFTEEKIISGDVFYETGVKKCAPPVKGHKELNKDSNKSATGKLKPGVPWAKGRNNHQLARDLAQAATVRYLKWAFNRWPELVGHCGGSIAFGVMADQRKEKE